MKFKCIASLLAVILQPAYALNTKDSDLIYKNGFELIINPQELRRAGINDLLSRYVGAFRTNVGSYIKGTIAYNPDGNSLFITASELTFSIGEYSIPIPSMSTDYNALPISSTIQEPAPMLARIPESSWSDLPLENSMMSLYYHNNQLLVNGALYYDAQTNNIDTTFKVADASDLANSSLVGNFTVTGLQHTTGWTSEIPEDWQPFLQKSHLLGGGFGLPIVGRLSFGPSLFTVNLNDLIGANTNSVVPTLNWMDFPQETPMGTTDFLNYGGATGGINNDLYTIMSVPSFGFIVPDSRTYMVIGGSSGHTPRTPGTTPYVGEVNDFANPNGTIFYKDTIEPIEPRQDTAGTIAEGYLAYDATDKGPYFWLFDLNEIISAKNPSDVLPYDKGYFPEPFPVQPGASRSFNVPLSGSWDPVSQRLFLSWPQVQPTVDGYNQSPVITVYQF